MQNKEYNNNILMMFPMIFSYILVFIIIYLSFFIFADNSVKNNDIYSEKIVRIVKNNTSKNTFLFNGSIDSHYIDNSITNILFNEIASYDKYADIETVLTFPVGVVIRTGSIYSRVYAYDKNILENGMSLSNIITEGSIFESPKREIIVGKDLADYLQLKIGDTLSLIAKASRGWLETGYFYVSGIYDFKDKNYDIIGDMTAMNSFIYLKEGSKSPYNESIIVFSDNDNIYSLLTNSSIINSNNLKAVSYDMKYYLENNNSIKNIAFIFIIASAFSLSLLSSSLLSLFYRRLFKYFDIQARKILNKLYIISLLISLIISAAVLFIFFSFIFNFLIFTISIILLSFVLSVFISNYNT
ncbi:hypothetical protein [uncultured Brachyspira sp.]|nr:hypothetical protein [uncultured Brachyspira sp.]